MRRVREGRIEMRQKSMKGWKGEGVLRKEKREEMGNGRLLWKERVMVEEKRKREGDGDRREWRVRERKER